MTPVLYNRKIALRDFTFMIVVISSPFLFYLHNTIPLEVREIDFLWFSINSGFFDSVHDYFWIMTIKIYTLILLSIWFITCTARWKLVITVPIGLEIFKVVVNINFACEIEDFYFSLMCSFPVVALYAFLLFYLSEKLQYVKDEAKILNILNFANSENLDDMRKINTVDYNRIYADFNELKKSKMIFEKKDYIAQLIILKKRMIK